MESSAIKARIGTTLRNKWVLERLLGYGGMAAVYVARHRIGRLEAIKILHRNLLENRELLVRFEREARVANRFRHPGAIQITDVDVADDGCPFLVMELAVGPTLTEHLRTRRPTPLEILRYADQILDVLATAHPLGIIHRDIKPSNLVIQQDGRLKVLDFGVAKIEGSTFTEQGATIGTAAYMPPEQVRGEAIDGRADLFAVGATLFRLLTGKPVRQGNNPGELLYQAATIPAPKVFDVMPDAPQEIGVIVDRALQFEATDRYQDARAMQADVKAAIALLTEESFASPDTVASPDPLAILQFPAKPDDDPTTVTPFSRGDSEPPPSRSGDSDDAATKAFEAVRPKRGI